MVLCHCSITKLCPSHFDTMNCSTRASLSFTISQRLLKFMSIESLMLSNHLIPCHPLLLLPSIFPSIRVFSNESALHIRWPKYWSFSISPSNEYSGLPVNTVPPCFVCAKSLQSCLTLCNPMDHSLPGPSLLGILQARIQEWVVMPSFRGSSHPKDRTQVYCIAGGFFTI